MKRWIINSLLDLDFYKLTMGQFVWRFFPDIEVRYALRVRSRNIRLREVIDESELRAELDHVRTLTFTKEEIDWLATLEIGGKKIFSPEYLASLTSVRLPRYRLEREIGGAYRLEFFGPWPKAIFWETIALSIVSELYYRTRLSETPRRKIKVNLEGRRRLMAKIEALKARPDISFADFGTRRRFSGAWQEFVIDELRKHLPKQFLGTSNVLASMKRGMTPIGTYAHELPMVLAGIQDGNPEAMRKSQIEVLNLWWELYGFHLSVALPDTYGSDFFLHTLPKVHAENWKGMRQDSGDPIAFGEKLISFYESVGIDPKRKLLLPSDGLTVGEMTRIADHFAGRIMYRFGWGTDLMNDLGFELPISMVVKPIEADGHDLVKFSDNLAKVSGKPSAAMRYAEVFGYNETYEEACVY